MSDELKENCGIFGIFGHKDAARFVYLGIYALQHRGQESAGIAIADGSKIDCYKGMGLVSEVFSEEMLSNMSGHLAVGHIRYSTTGSSVLKNAQPLMVDYFQGPVAIAHNGNLVNTRAVRRRLEAHGSIFQSTMDSEVIVHLLARANEARFEDRLIKALKQVKGAYSLLVMNKDRLIGVRDPQGFPLTL